MKSQKYTRVLWEEKIKNKLFEEEEIKTFLVKMLTQLKKTEMQNY